MIKYKENGTRDVQKKRRWRRTIKKELTSQILTLQTALQAEAARDALRFLFRALLSTTRCREDWLIDCGRFSAPSFYIILSKSVSHAYFNNHSPFSREHIIVEFNEFPASLVCWCIDIHHRQPQGPTLIQRGRRDFMCVHSNVCTDTGPPVLSSIRED